MIMGEIRIIIDLPGDKIVRSLKMMPYEGYDSARLADAIKGRLARELPDVKQIKVVPVAANLFFGVDIMGTKIEDVLSTMEKLPGILAEIVDEVKSAEIAK